MAMASSSGEVRRRKKPQTTTASNPSSSLNNNNDVSSTSKKKRRHPSNNPRAAAAYDDETSSNFGNGSGGGATATTNNNASETNKDYDEYAWFVIFLVALSYFIVTRGGGGGSHRRAVAGGVLSSFSKPYEVVSSSVTLAAAHDDDEGASKKSEELLRSLFYIDNYPSSAKKQESDTLILAPNSRLEVILSSPPDRLHKKNSGAEKNEECVTTNDSEPNNKHSQQQQQQQQQQQHQNSIPYLSHLTSTTWVHDEELGRGYLLLADAGRSGRIWRWEVGGGPITIGRSLHMERSGCRSGLWLDHDNDAATNGRGANGTCPQNLFGDTSSSSFQETSCSKPSSSSSTSSSTKAAPFPNLPPLLGSASLAVELTRNAERASAGANIVVAEWGERRIVRVEGETGARTPLVTLVPTRQREEENDNVNVEKQEQQQQSWRRIYRPNHLTYTPFGDLLFSDNYQTNHRNHNNRTTSSSHSPHGTIYRRKEAVHVPPIPVEQSRSAHGWRGTTHPEKQQHVDDNDEEGTIDILFETHGQIEGMALGLDFATLFVLVTTAHTDDGSGWTKTVYRLFLGADDDDGDKEEDDEDEKGGDAAKVDTGEVTIFYKMTGENCNNNHPDTTTIGSKLAIDEKGTVYLIGCPSSITLLDKDNGTPMGVVSLDELQTTQPQTFPSKSSLSSSTSSSSSTSTTASSRIFTSIGFGEDGYLYITSPMELMRLKSRVGGMALPTDLVVPPPLKPKKDDKQ